MKDCSMPFQLVDPEAVQDAARKQRDILAIVNDLVSDFLYYNRKEDDDFPVGQIEWLCAIGAVSVDAIINEFSRQVILSVEQARNEMNKPL